MLAQSSRRRAIVFSCAFLPAVAASLTYVYTRPAEYRADLVIVLTQDPPAHGIVVEVRLVRDDDKEYLWPAYVCNLRKRICSPVCLLVVTVDEHVGRRASRWIDLGGENRFRPWVLATRIALTAEATLPGLDSLRSLR